VKYDWERNMQSWETGMREKSPQKKINNKKNKKDQYRKKKIVLG
jgi:hypothetical protein